MSARFRINAPHVINEVIDGEAVIINLATGDYYSLRGSGSYIWQALDAGATTSAIAAAAASSTDRSAAELEPVVRALVDELVGEGLIIPTDDRLADPPLAPPDGNGFEAPSLEKFSDMQDLILLDPVHEVDERGWPHAPSA